MERMLCRFRTRGRKNFGGGCPSREIAASDTCSEQLTALQGSTTGAVPRFKKEHLLLFFQGGGDVVVRQYRIVDKRAERVHPCEKWMRLALPLSRW